MTQMDVDVVLVLFQVDLKTGLAIEEACYSQVCLHNDNLHESENLNK